MTIKELQTTGLETGTTLPYILEVGTPRENRMGAILRPKATTEGRVPKGASYISSPEKGGNE